MTTREARPYAFSDPLFDSRMKPANPEAERRQAALAICSEAASLAEARDLLAMVGLIPAEHPRRPLGKKAKAGPHQRLDARIAELWGQGLTVAAIAERLGINSQQVTRWRERQVAEEARGGRAERFDAGWEGL